MLWLFYQMKLWEFDSNYWSDLLTIRSCQFNMWSSGISGLSICLIFALTQIFHHQHMFDTSINIEEVKALNRSVSTKINIIHSSILINTRKNIGQLSRKSFTGGRYYLCALVILNSADCHPNPGPQANIEYPGFVCGKEVLDDHAGIKCDDCDCWYHTSCINMGNNTYNILSKSNIAWICAKWCSLNTTHSNMNDNSIIDQQSYYTVLSDDQVDPAAPPQCTSTPVKSARNKSEKNVSKPANKLTNNYSKHSKYQKQKRDDLGSHWYQETINSCGEWNMA